MHANFTCIMIWLDSEMGFSRLGTFVKNIYSVNPLTKFSKLGACLQRPLNTLCEFFIFTSLEVDLSKTQSMIFGHNERKLNQKAFYLNKDQFEITHEYEILGDWFLFTWLF